MSRANTQLTESDRLASAFAGVDLSLERRLEKRFLYSWIDAIPHQKQSMLFLTGESGTGKSQLAKKVVRRSIRRGYVVGSGSVTISNGPYGVIIDSIKGLMNQLSEEPGNRNLEAYIETRPGLIDLLGVPSTSTLELAERRPRGKEDINRGALFRELGRVLRMISKRASTSSLRRPVLMVIEDAHLAQVETIDLLGFLAEFCSSDSIGFLVVATGPDRLVDALVDVQTDLRRRQLADTVFLKGFDDHQTESLIRKVFRRNRFSPPFRRLLRQASAGNPTSTLQMLWLLKQCDAIHCDRQDWTLKETVSLKALPVIPSDAVADRILTSGSRIRELLCATAVLGRSAREDDVQALLNWDRKRLTETLSDLHDLYPALHRDEGLLTFATQSLHDATYRSIQLDERNVLHRLAADRLETDGDVALDERVAGHLEAAGFAGEALPFRLSAGERALHFCSPGRAAINFEHALETASGRAAEAEVRFDLLLKAASSLTSMKRYDEAAFHLEEAVELAKQCRKLGWEARAKKQLGKIASCQRELGNALGYYDQSLALYRADGDESGQCDVLLKTSRVYHDLGMWEQLNGVYEEAFRLAQANQNSVQVAAISMNLAIMHSLRGNTDKALESFHRCLRIYRWNGLWDKVTMALLNIAKALADSGNTDEAERYNNTALETARKRFDTAREAAALTNLGEIHLQNDNLEAAESVCHEALNLFEEACDHVRAADALRVLAGIATKSLDVDRASGLFQRAIERSRNIGFRLGEAQSLRDYGQLLDQRDPDAAGTARRQARDLFVSLGIHDEADRLDTALRNRIAGRFTRAG